MTKDEAFKELERDNPISVVDAIYSYFIQDIDKILSDTKYTKSTDIFRVKLESLKKKNR